MQWINLCNNCAVVILIYTAATLGTTSARPKNGHRLEDGNDLRKAVMSPESKFFCLYGNKTVPAGRRLRPDACTKCHCPKHGGRLNCAIEDCRYQPNCVEWKKEEGECCGTCIKTGCIHSDNNVYDPGTLVLDTPCEQCYCPPAGGRVVCTKAPCPRPACVDAVSLSGHCCQTCPNGANCWFDGRVLPVGEVGYKQTPEGCLACHCPVGPLPHWIDPANVQATCSHHAHC